MEKIEINKNLTIVKHDYDRDNIWCFTNLRTLEYFKIEAHSGYEGEAYIEDIDKNLKKIDINTLDYEELGVLRALNVISEKEKEQRHEKATLLRQKESTLFKARQEKELYLKLKEKYGK